MPGTRWSSSPLLAGCARSISFWPIAVLEPEPRLSVSALSPVTNTSTGGAGAPSGSAWATLEMAPSAATEPIRTARGALPARSIAIVVARLERGAERASDVGVPSALGDLTGLISAFDLGGVVGQRAAER